MTSSTSEDKHQPPDQPVRLDLCHDADVSLADPGLVNDLVFIILVTRPGAYTPPFLSKDGQDDIDGGHQGEVSLTGSNLAHCPSVSA